MHKSYLRIALCLFAVVLFSTTAATARGATITDTVNFSVPFTSGTYAASIPGDTPSAVTGSFTINFDPTLTYTDERAGINLTDLTGITVDSGLAFSYSTSPYSVQGSPQRAFTLAVGTLAGGVAELGTNGFYLYISGFTTNPQVDPNGSGFGYVTPTGDGFFLNLGPTGSSVIVTPDSGTPGGTPPSATPEPGTLSLMATGLLGVAGALRRKFRTA